jgi:hypothetical protein
MGIQYERGYSAEVEGFFVHRSGARIRLAKTNGSSITLAETYELAPGTVGELLVIVDGQSDSRQVLLPDGVAKGQTVVSYSVAAPF